MASGVLGLTSECRTGGLAGVLGRYSGFVIQHVFIIHMPRAMVVGIESVNVPWADVAYVRGV